MLGLNTQQRTAVMHIEGPTLVLAGAGSGKTRVIIEKIAHLIQINRYTPGRIAAITFTNKSAKEMRQRVKKRIHHHSVDEITICTFHALGLKILMNHYQAVGLRRAFSIFGKDDTTQLLKEIMPGATPDVIQQAQATISQAKNQGLNADGLIDSARTPREKDIAKSFSLYQSRLASFNAVDFDDLLCLPVKILMNDAAILANWRERIGYLLIDEYQDTNCIQYQLLKYLSGPSANFTCVGDDDQSIYAWRGANPENIGLLAHDFPNLNLIKLEQNYRCTNRILRTANTLIAKNPHLHNKKLWSDRGDGTRIRVIECRDQHHEAEKVAANILYLSQKDNINWNNFCILYRSNFQSKPIEKALQFLRIPYSLSGGIAFLDNPEIRDILAWLRLIINPSDDMSFLRAVQSPRRDIGSASLAKIAEMAAAKELPLLRTIESVSLLKSLTPRVANRLNEFSDLIATLKQKSQRLTPSDFVRQVIESSGIIDQLRRQSRDFASFDRRKAHLDELAQWFENNNQTRTVSDMAAQLMLLTRDSEEDNTNQIRLMSLHASKGLEFLCVFIIGCEEGVLPHQVSIDQGQIEEERRLFYVGMTRAKENLYLSYCKSSQKFNETLHKQPSRFLNELPPEEVHWDGVDLAIDAQHKRDRIHSHISNIAHFFEEI